MKTVSSTDRYLIMSTNPIILITGANTGLGFETIKALCRSSKPYTILLGGRSIQKAEDAVQLANSEFPNTQSSLAPIQVDIEEDDSISKAFEDISSTYRRVDVLINNAGEYAHDPIGSYLTIQQVLNSTLSSTPAA